MRTIVPEASRQKHSLQRRRPQFDLLSVQLHGNQWSKVGSWLQEMSHAAHGIPSHNEKKNTTAPLWRRWTLPFRWSGDTRRFASAGTTRTRHPRQTRAAVSGEN